MSRKKLEAYPNFEIFKERGFLNKWIFVLVHSFLKAPKDPLGAPLPAEHTSYHSTQKEAHDEMNKRRGVLARGKRDKKVPSDNQSG